MDEKQPIIAPSILSANFANIQQDVEMLNQSEADWVHIDIMDGVFVPNISFGIPVVKAIQKYAKKPLDVHLMIQKPENYINQFVEAGAAILTVHYESCPHLHRTIEQIKNLGCRAGVAINPHTSVYLLKDIIHEIDLVCIMSVNPGFSGQQFIENTYKKVIQLKEIIEYHQENVLVEVDGGVNIKNGSKLVKLGTDVLVAGSFVFKSENPPQTIQHLKTV